MPASTYFSNAVLLHLLQNANIANIGDATGLRGALTVGNFWIALHTANPGVGGTAVTSETAYTNYVRQALVRGSAAFSVSTNTFSNAATVTFPSCGATGATITNFSIVDSASGAGNIIVTGTCSLVVSSGITPSFAIGALTGSLT